MDEAVEDGVGEGGIADVVVPFADGELACQDASTAADSVIEQLEQIDDRELDRVAAIIHSMTPQERRDTKVLNGSRRARIAKGAGVQVSDVNNLVDRFTEAQKMMKRMRSGGGGMPGVPGMPPMPGMSKKAKGKGKPPKAKKGRSGNPAKRAQQDAGVTEQQPDAPFTPDQLPDEFTKLLGGGN